MKSFYIRILIGFAIVSCSCSHKDHSVTLIRQNGNPLMIMNQNRISDSIIINLSDIAKDLKFIRLETNPECLIARSTYYITDKYILAKTKNGIFQFDINGKFMRNLVTRGEGPREFSEAEWVVDEKKERLILADEQKTTYFLYFDLKTGEYLGDIPKAIQGVTRKFVLTKYGSLACVPYLSPGTDPGPLYLYWQDLEGKLIDMVRGPADLGIFRGNYLSQIPEGYRYQLAINNKDTIYTLREKALIPYLAFNHGEEVPENMDETGFRIMKIVLETDRYLFLCKDQITHVVKSENNPSTSWNSSEYVLDKDHSKAFAIPGIFNDLVGASEPAQFFKILPNAVIYTALQTLELLGMAERAIANPKSDQKLIGRMEEIRDQLNRDDNPVLLVGKIK